MCTSSTCHNSNIIVPYLKSPSLSLQFNPSVFLIQNFSMKNYGFKQSKELYVENQLKMGWAGDEEEQL